MGCWNATCGVTQMPIKYEEPVRAFFVYIRGWEDDPDHRTGDWSGTVYPTEIASPYPIPLEGQYDDYGGIEGIKEGVARIAIPSHFEVDQEGLDEFVRLVERGSVTREDPVWPEFHGEVGVGLFFVHGHIYDSIRETPYYKRFVSDGEHYFKALDRVDWSRYVDKKEYESDEEYREHLETLSLEEELIENLMERRRFRLSAPFNNSKVPYPFVTKVDSEYRYNMFEKVFSSGRREGLAGGTIGATPEAEIAIRAAYLQGKRYESDPEVQEMMRELAHAYAFRQFMYRARKQWIPGSNKGSQDDCLYPHLHLAKHMIKHLKDVDATRWSVWNEDNENWSDLLDEFDIEAEELG